MKIERDAVRFLGGVRGGETLGGPIAIAITNRDHERWRESMSASPFTTAPERLTRPRPGHADLAGGVKYDRTDLRDILERASARETAARVAVGAIAKALLSVFDFSLASHVVRIGPIEAPSASSIDAIRRAQESDVGCADEGIAVAMRAHIHEASHRGDTVGGVVEVVAVGCPPGLGSHIQWDRKLDGRIAQALMSIQAIKGVEIGLGMRAAALPGSSVHDAIVFDPETRSFSRATNGAGGIEGGMTNGMPVVVRAAMKPIATLRRALPSVDVVSKEPVEAAFERSDVCAVPAAAVIAEGMVALVLADAFVEKFGGDSVREMHHNVEGYRAQVRRYGE